MRDASLAVLREIGVDTGGSNVSSRSIRPTAHDRHRDESARVAFVGAGLRRPPVSRLPRSPPSWRSAFTLDELKNDITGGKTPASFEPSIDYVVTKIPAFAFEKFPQANAVLTTQMKSVGEGDGDGPHLPGIAAESAARPETGRVDGLDEVTTDLRNHRNRTGRPGRNASGISPMLSAPA